MYDFFTTKTVIILLLLHIHSYDNISLEIKNKLPDKFIETVIILNPHESIIYKLSPTPKIFLYYILYAKLIKNISPFSRSPEHIKNLSHEWHRFKKPNLCLLLYLIYIIYLKLLKT